MFVWLWAITLVLCPDFGLHGQGTAFTPLGTEYMLSSVDALNQMNTSRSFWVDYPEGFDPPLSSLDPALYISVVTERGERQIDIFTDGNRYYVLPYVRLDEYADAAGNHMGTHPCRAFWIAPEEYEALIASFDGYTQSSDEETR